MLRTAISHLLGLAGAALGGFVGYFLFLLALHQGFYALALPGALLGAGCGLLARHESVGRGIACGVAGLVLGILSEWITAPFTVDGSLGYFLGHLRELKLFTALMIALGTGMAFWMGKGAAIEAPDEGELEARRRRAKHARMRDLG